MTHFSVLPDLSGDIISSTELVAEALTFIVKKKTTDASESLSSKELDFGVRVLGIDKSGRVDLDLLHIDRLAPDVNGHLVSITCGVVSVRGRQVVEFRAVLFDEGGFGEVSGVAPGGKDDRSIGFVGLSLAVFVLAPHDALALLDELNDVGLLHDLDTIGLSLSQIFEPLQLGICDNHPGELRITTMGTRLGVATETSDFGEVQPKLLLEPVDRIARSPGKDLDQIISSKFLGLAGKSGVRVGAHSEVDTYGCFGIVKEDLCTISNI